MEPGSRRLAGGHCDSPNAQHGPGFISEDCTLEDAGHSSSRAAGARIRLVSTNSSGRPAAEKIAGIRDHPARNARVRETPRGPKWRSGPSNRVKQKWHSAKILGKTILPRGEPCNWQFDNKLISH